MKHWDEDIELRETHGRGMDAAIDDERDHLERISDAADQIQRCLKLSDETASRVLRAHIADATTFGGPEIHGESTFQSIAGYLLALVCALVLIVGLLFFAV